MIWYNSFITDGKQALEKLSDSLKISLLINLSLLTTSLVPFPQCFQKMKKNYLKKKKKNKSDWGLP